LPAAEGQFPAPGRVHGQTGQVQLGPDELSPFGLAVFLEPVREDQARGVVVRLVGDRPQQVLFLDHDRSGGLAGIVILFDKDRTTFTYLNDTVHLDRHTHFPDKLSDGWTAAPGTAPPELRCIRTSESAPEATLPPVALLLLPLPCLRVGVAES